ncbi:uncharacterized protein N7482_003332 [Penicillium canariense]|uniref:Uncharacterized protein n=1 Tax=Penicillium canariense TaxID=189055 RepID=A0A9W9LPH8_9EURO|nr:uncharacterized protein N7482_003332 [Penicillium canariense]KAJ5167738.1 hypothetical protein N7482_003332 [Penicillium canariense]
MLVSLQLTTRRSHQDHAYNIGHVGGDYDWRVDIMPPLALSIRAAGAQTAFSKGRLKRFGGETSSVPGLVWPGQISAGKLGGVETRSPLFQWDYDRGAVRRHDPPGGLRFDRASRGAWYCSPDGPDGCVVRKVHGHVESPSSWVPERMTPKQSPSGALHTQGKGMLAPFPRQGQDDYSMDPSTVV